jgi:CRISPR-associated protein Csh1
MIQEIVNFVDTLPGEAFINNIQPKEGLYILLDINEVGNLINVDSEGKILDNDIGFYSKKDEQLSEAVSKSLPLWMNTVPVSNAKIFNPIKKIFGNTCSPFAFSFNKKNWEKYKNQKLLQKQFEDETISKEQISDKFEEFMRGEMTIYFNIAEQYVDNEKHREWLKIFRNYLRNNIFNLMDNLQEFGKLKSAQGIYFLYKKPTVKDYQEPYQNYLAAKVFNKYEYNKVKLSIKEIYGISDSVSYFNDKKPFLKHTSAPILYNYRVTGKEATRIWQFFNLQKNKQLPNPMPVFVHQPELTQKLIKLHNNEKGKLGYVELIKKLLSKHSENLSNYYLIFFDVRAKKSKVADIDFVSNFRYEMNDVKINEVFSLNGHLEAKTKVKNVFDFECKIFNLVFNNQLIPKENWRRYFDELDAHRMSVNTYDQLMRYRKPIYDYVFKSTRQAITSKMFNDIMLKGVLDDIRLDDNRKNDYSIKAKLNIWFSLYEYFDYTQFNKLLNAQSMVNKTEKLMSRISTIATNENEHLENDDEFAFAVGQIIYFLLSKNDIGNRTHALLEPFLQKTDAILLKREIARCFNMYKHAIKFYAQKREFDKIMSEVMGVEPDEKNMKNLLPSTLAGYFSQSIFSKKAEN